MRIGIQKLPFWGFKQESDVLDVIHLLAPSLQNTYWMFSKIDSTPYGESKVEFIKRKLSEIDVDLIPSKLGLLLRNRDIIKVSNETDLIIHYNAVYILESFNTINEMEKIFTKTSEEMNFSEEKPEALINLLKEMDFLAFFSDGLGLNYFICDQTISSIFLRNKEMV